MDTEPVTESPNASTSLILVRASIDAADPTLPTTAVRVDRQKLARRRWRGKADDGTDFGFELEVALRDGDVVWVTQTARYVIRQSAEPLLEISVALPPDQAAVVGWAVGNMHAVIEAQADRILAPDDPGLRQALDRIGIGYRPAVAVFQPHRFAGVVGHSHGPDAAVESHPYVRRGPPKTEIPKG